ncbi:ABC transporter permease [Acidisphaera rubrifaciens]|uniref:ABC transporter amino acid permease n=1 Tax=Acidisphaera rubrifaciens HS-AP3 TaxID=1231350 RepID=A0A0D6P9L9_9PROT|nr:ABC transporter permease [Acidisphaera rubrifaciens]GAN78056.1 ABC transporter amino acid permease [Acidisphaera rubrifaciens HS-AP3]
MTGGVLIPLLQTVVTSATPLLFAALGELVAERSGVLNLGVEGMMLAGAVFGFAVMTATGSDTLALLAAAAAGTTLALLFGVLALTLAASQVATGLALTIFGTGLSTLIGARYTGRTVPPLPRLDVPGLSELPVIGPLLFRYDAMVYLSVASAFAIGWFLRRTRGGMVLRAVGESDVSAHSIGHPVIRIRYLAVLFGGAMAGLGGAYLSLAYTPLWAEQMTAGRGWIALALVVFAAWRPGRALMGAYLFGGITVLQLYLQGSGLVAIPTQILAMVPYIATIVVLTVISSASARSRLSAPACLGKTFRVAT